MKIRECKAQRRRFGSFFYRFPSGESPADVYDRVSSFLESLYRMFEKTSEENYVLVTHGVAIRVILTRYFKYRISEFEQLENFHNGELVVLEFNECQGKFMLKTIVTNDVRILEDGSVAVETDETTQLRVHPSDTMSAMSRPYSTSPINHFRHPPPPSPPTSSTTSSRAARTRTCSCRRPRPPAPPSPWPTLPRPCGRRPLPSTSPCSSEGCSNWSDVFIQRCLFRSLVKLDTDTAYLPIVSLTISPSQTYILPPRLAPLLSIPYRSVGFIATW